MHAAQRAPPRFRCTLFPACIIWAAGPRFQVPGSSIHFWIPSSMSILLPSRIAILAAWRPGMAGDRYCCHVSAIHRFPGHRRSSRPTGAPHGSRPRTIVTVLLCRMARYTTALYPPSLDTQLSTQLSMASHRIVMSRKQVPKATAASRINTASACFRIGTPQRRRPKSRALASH